MRPIKYRAYINGERREVFGIDRCSVYIFCEPPEGYHDISPVTKRCDILTVNLVQYTGLKDKNGNEIFEGDVIYHEHYGRYKIVWKRDGACFHTECIETCGLKSYMFTNLFDSNKGSVLNCEVIGNVYENRELFEGLNI